MQARQLRTGMALAFGALWASLAVQPVCGQSSWRTGNDLAGHLLQPVGITWRDKPLAEALDDLGKVHRLGLLRDRRLDPGRPIDLDWANRPLGDALDQLATAQGWGVGQVGDVLYLAPETDFERVATAIALLEAEAANWPSEIRNRWQKAEPLAWPHLTEPRKLVERWANEAGVRLANPEALEHDLWPAVELPRLSLAARLGLVAGQFGLMVQSHDGREARLVPLPERLLIERRYPAGRDPAGRLEEYRRLAPGADIVRDGRSLVVRGTQIDQLRIEQGRRPTPRPMPMATETRYTLTVENQPLGGVLQALAQQLGLELQVDAAALAAADVPLGTLVSLRTQDATADEVFQQLLDPLGLTHRIDARRVTVQPK